MRIPRTALATKQSDSSRGRVAEEMAYFGALVLTLALTLLVSAGCNRRTSVTVSAEKARDSHQAMLRRLAEVAETAFETNEYFDGVTKLPDAERELAAAIESGSLVDQLEAHKTVGLYELNLGNSESAAKHLRTACDLMPQITQQKLAHISPKSQITLLTQCGVAMMRVAEDQNCVHCTNGMSCILPIGPEGVHQRPEGATAAREVFLEILRLDPKNVTATWLLNIASMTLGQYPDGVPPEYRISKERFEATGDFPRFRNVSFDLGLDTLSHSGGAIADDFDGDDLLDVIVTSWHPEGQMRHFRNLGDGRFREVTQESNLLGITGGLNCVQADYDNDGDIDILVLRGAWMTGAAGQQPNSLLQNDGSGRFFDVTFAVGLGDVAAPTQTAAWADYDLDGDLDLFIGNEQIPSQLFRNDGKKFVDVASKAGTTNDAGYAKAVALG